MLDSAIEAGKAFVRFVLDDKQFKASLKQAGTQLKNFGKIGLAVTGPLTAAFSAATAQFVSAGSALKDISDRTGVSVESLSELKFAAEQSGTSLGAVEKALRKMAKDGLDVSTFDEVAAKIAAIEDPSKRAAAAIKTFGKSGAELIPMILELDTLRQSAHDTGNVMTGEMADAADILGDVWDTLTSQVKSLGNQIGFAVSGPITSFLDATSLAIGDVTAWAAANPDLVLSVGLVTAAVAGLSAGTLALGVSLSILSANPILLWLDALAVGALAVAGAFVHAQDVIDEIVGEIVPNEVEILNVPLNPKDRKRAALDAQMAQAEEMRSQLQQQAESFQAQIQGSIGPVNPAAPQTMDSAGITATLEKSFGRPMEETAANTAELVKINNRMLAVLQSRRGGFVVGAG